jgi:hypothetical protein
MKNAISANRIATTPRNASAHQLPTMIAAMPASDLSLVTIENYA